MAKTPKPLTAADIKREQALQARKPAGSIMQSGANGGPELAPPGRSILDDRQR